jgi:hypothetical protein
MALLPYTSRVTQQRGARERGDRGDRGLRPDGPMPRPTAPPPSGVLVDDATGDDMDLMVAGPDDEQGFDDIGEAEGDG